MGRLQALSHIDGLQPGWSRCVVASLGLLALVALVVMMALYAEAGHRGYEYMSVLLWLILGGLLYVGVVATVGAARTLRR